MKPKVVAKSVLVNPEGKILVLRRSQTDSHAPGRVDFPGGGVDEGESIVAAALREIQEEVGLTIAPEVLHLAYASTAEPNESGDIITRLLFVGHVATSEVELSYEHDMHWWREPATVTHDFDHTSWSEGLQFIIEHNITESIV